MNALVEENVRGLAKIAANGTAHKMAEEFRYAGTAVSHSEQIPEITIRRSVRPDHESITNSFDIGDGTVLQSQPKSQALGRSRYKCGKRSRDVAFPFGDDSARTKRTRESHWVCYPTRAALPSPTPRVSVIHLATNTTATVRTTPAGDYNVSNLSPGRYRVEISAAGFKRFVQEDVTLHGGRHCAAGRSAQSGTS